MERLEAALLKSDARAALRRLGEDGDLELVAEEPVPSTEARAEKAAAGKTPGRRAADLRNALGLGARAPEPLPGEMDLPSACAELAALEAAAEQALKQARELSADHARLSAEAEKINPYRALPLPAGGGFSYIYCAAGSLPAGSLQELRLKAPLGAVLVPLEEKNGRRHLAAAGLAADGPALEAALKLCGFQPADLPFKAGVKLSDLAGQNAAALAETAEKLARARSALNSFAANAAGPLAAIERALYVESRLAEAESGLAGTETSVLLSGWVPAAEAPELKRGLAEVTGGRCAARTLPPSGEVPVLLRPPRLLRPFAALVAIYGLPRYGEVEPTLFAAVSYLFMFGMMFGDAGHGAVLCLAGLWLALRRTGKLRDAGKIIFCCGLSSAAFGLVYGSFFGLPSFKKYALWRDPLEGDPLALLKAAVLTGIVVISTGVLLNIANKLRSGDRLGAALDRFGAAGLVFYWCALLWAAGLAGGRAMLPPVALALACWVLKGPALALLGRPGAEGGLAGAAEALVGAFEGVLLYLANTVSFVRLAAYAMSHAALLAAAWALAAEADKTWGAGSIAGLFAVVAGNAAALGLEGLVAGVQALRLEYYEFFGKFFEGSGRPFKPFTLKLTGGIE
jgi:V/A-type H+-transporting ATPase subunit I